MTERNSAWVLSLSSDQERASWEGDFRGRDDYISQWLVTAASRVSSNFLILVQCLSVPIVGSLMHQWPP